MNNGSQTKSNLPHLGWQKYLLVAAVFVILLLGTLWILNSSLYPEPATYRLAVTSPPCGEWHAVLGPRADGGGLNGIVSISEDDVWAVGSRRRALGFGATRPLVEHWNGTQWHAYNDLSDVPDDAVLYGVAATTSADIWAVGEASGRTLIEHWDGIVWKIMSSPSPGKSPNVLKSVVAVSTNDAWAVGSFVGDDDKDKTLVLHWDGSTWSVVPSPNGVGLYNQLYTVAAFSRNDLWAAGNTMMLHSDGKSWSAVPKPADVCAINSISAVSNQDVWAVGGTPNCGMHILHWNGSDWTSVPDAGISRQGLNYLSGVIAFSHNDVWVVGRSYEGDRPKSIVAHWDGNVWRDVPLPKPTSDQAINAIASLGPYSLWIGGEARDDEGAPDFVYAANFRSTTCSSPQNTPQNSPSVPPHLP